MKDELELISWLQKWYHQFCNGDWEHNETINIHTIDNPGWYITIDLEGTYCENKSFDKIRNEISEDNWFHCFVRDGKFTGAGGPCNLINILQVFKGWAELYQEEDIG